MEHYFSENPIIESSEKEIEYKIFDKKIKMTTDNGVFSKNRVDFGTDLLLKTFIKKEEKNKDKKVKILDIGCGYGVVSIVIKTFFPNADIVLSDVNERALELSKKNLLKNNILKYEILKSNLYDGFKEEDENSFDFIISNPPIRTGKQNIFKLYEDAKDYLKLGGTFYCVIQTKHGAKSTQKRLEEIYGNNKVDDIDKGYRILSAQKKKKEITIQDLIELNS